MTSTSTYCDIFTQRGAQYQAAMEYWPQARTEEFLQILADAQLQPNLVVYDAPAGGGYLMRYMKTKVNLLEIETTQGFDSPMLSSHRRVYCADLADIALASESADRVISLAGMHHQRAQGKVFHEFVRLLRRGGLLALADVDQDSPCAAFLNEFVHQYCPLGHSGIFFGTGLQNELHAAGLRVQQDRRIALHWHFPHESAMVHFCRLLFGLDLADTPTVLAGITHYLGYEKHTNGIAMNWELRYVQAIRL